MNRSARSTPRHAAALLGLTGALLLAGCGHHAQHHAGGALPAEGLRIGTATLDRVLAEGGALCVGMGGNAAACTPRPGIKYELDKLAPRPLVDLGSLKPAERPAFVVCRLDYRQNPPTWRCTEVYAGQP